jgi:hypothetical protein
MKPWLLAALLLTGCGPAPVMPAATFAVGPSGTMPATSPHQARVVATDETSAPEAVVPVVMAHQAVTSDAAPAAAAPATSSLTTETPAPAAPAPALLSSEAVEAVEAVEAITLAAPAIEAEASRAEGPQSGVWLIRYPLGEGNWREEELTIRFEADGTVAVDGQGPALTDFPSQWTAEEASFEGMTRRDLLGGSSVSRDRLQLTVDSATAMHGTLSLRVNFRWIPLEATAQFVRPVDQPTGLAITAGTIEDTLASEQFGE